MTKDQNIIGERLRIIRKGKKIKQDQLAARCYRLGWDITENTITKIENKFRCVTDRELIILIRALRVKFRDFFPDQPWLF